MRLSSFSVLVDMKHFLSEELSVKVVGDHIYVHSKHEEHPEKHSYISWEFHHHYLITKGVDSAAITSALSLDGLLSITAPTAHALPALECTIPITHQEKSAVIGK
uniref:SHSP domain-containing protein n=1 Tax=Salvator merianae TaxID=96440 RepID=A0A8D0DSK5_SALMN